jgi:hypothetical protein
MLKQQRCIIMCIDLALLALAVAAAGENIDRNGACKDTSKSVIVRTTDTCPCSYPNNYFSESQAMTVASSMYPVTKCVRKRCF